jgi:hypothetical protein
MLLYIRVKNSYIIVDSLFYIIDSIGLVFDKYENKDKKILDVELDEQTYRAELNYYF